MQQSGMQSEIYSSISNIAKVTPDLDIEDREGMCRAIMTLCELGQRLVEKEKTPTN